MQSRKILVIDDEVMVADVSRNILTHTGHQVCCTFSGEQAVQLTMETCFDLAIIDALLPGMNGIETFEMIRQLCPQTKGILLSGELTVGMVMAAMEQGFSKVLAKPLQAGLLTQIVESTLVETNLQEKNVNLQKELAQMRVLLGQYMAPEVVKILLERGHPASRFSGRVQEITVLFADIRNFTLLIQHLPLLKAQQFLTNFFDMTAEVIASRNGTLDKFIGDAALALFGAPIEQEAPSWSAVSAAIEIQQNFENLRSEWGQESALFAQIGLGIGISRGAMYLGDVGSSRRLDYTVIGADVNIAQRLASETTAGQILVTESVHREVADRCSIQEEKNRQLRGLDKTIRLYSIVP